MASWTEKPPGPDQLKRGAAKTDVPLVNDFEWPKDLADAIDAAIGKLSNYWWARDLAVVAIKIWTAAAIFRVITRID